MNAEFAFITIGTILVLWLPLYYIYWWLVRPALATKLRVAITHIEGQVIEKLLEKDLRDRREPLEIVLSRCQRAKRNVHRLSICRVLLSEITPGIVADFNRERLLLARSSPDIRELDAAITLRLYFAILINSPLFSTIGVGLVALMEFFDRFRRLFNAVTARSWEATASDLRTA
jgi:hypothetical protein